MCVHTGSGKILLTYDHVGVCVAAMNVMRARLGVYMTARNVVRMRSGVCVLVRGWGGFSVAFLGSIPNTNP